jgi:hypothetical protein
MPGRVRSDFTTIRWWSTFDSGRPRFGQRRAKRLEDRLYEIRQFPTIKRTVACAVWWVVAGQSRPTGLVPTDPKDRVDDTPQAGMSAARSARAIQFSINEFPFHIRQPSCVVVSHGAPYRLYMKGNPKVAAWAFLGNQVDETRRLQLRADRVTTATIG